MRYLGVDFGLKRVGLSISEGELASPLKTVEGKNIEDLVDKVAEVNNKENVDEVVVGMPEGKTGELGNKFIKELQKKGLNVKIADETLSTQAASKLMIAMGIPRKKRMLNDAYAAALILQNYLDSK